MRTIFLFLLFLVSSLANAQQKKDTIDFLEYKPRWYLNHIRDSVQVKEDIRKAIEQTKPKPRIKFYNRLCYNYTTKKPVQFELVFSYKLKFI